MINTYIAKDLNLTTAIFELNTINLNQKIIYIFIKNLFYYKVKIKSSLKLFRIYLLSHIQTYDPKYAITFFDNRPLFYEMSYLCKGIRFSCDGINDKGSYLITPGLYIYFL